MDELVKRDRMRRRYVQGTHGHGEHAGVDGFDDLLRGVLWRGEGAE